ncbi:MAG: hypothetical protein OXG44_00835 [Gammaproteobacteria bacterium]|nr:hypothetical protein [Gammaproteobacteria bacterium]MDE0178091.1 hypothetical protein [Gammaproteobacteria bacterium]
MFDRRRAHHEPRADRFGLNHGDDGLAGLAEAHVVGQDRPATPEKETDAFYLVWVEIARNFARSACGGT